jgi:hypothetical protein
MVERRSLLPPIRSAREFCLFVQAALSCNASVGSNLGSDDRLGLDKSETLVKAPRRIVGGLCRLRVLRDVCG